MELRRYNDIVAIKQDQGPALALHARNLEVADISEELWQQLPIIQWHDNHAPSELSSTRDQDVIQALENWNQEENENITSTSIKFGIRSLTINVTQVCNLHCVYCAAGGDGTYGDPIKKIAVEKTLPQIQFFLQQLPKGETFHISFLGGEPLLYPEAVKALGLYTMQEAEKKGITASFKVTTNGTVITDKAIDALTSLKAHVVISLDGPAEINDQQRPSRNGQGSTAKILEGLQKLSTFKSSLSSLGVHGVFDQKNLDVFSAYKFYLELNFDWIEFTYGVTDHDPIANEKYLQGLAKIAEFAYKSGGETELRRISNFSRYFDILDRQERVLNHCGLGRSLVVIDARNKIYNCPWTVGRTQDQLGENSDLNYDRIEGYQKTLIERNSCESCWARFFCGGGCSFIHESTGSQNPKDKNKKKADFCIRTRYTIALVLLYYRASRALAS